MSLTFVGCVLVLGVGSHGTIALQAHVTLLRHPWQERMGAISHTVITEVGVFGSADSASARFMSFQVGAFGCYCCCWSCTWPSV